MKRGRIEKWTARTFSPVGGCIYCRKSADEVALEDEHILPLGLGGMWVLPKASCRECAAITGKDEARVLRGGLRAARQVLEYPSRSPKGPERLPLFCVNDDEDSQLLVDIEHYPILLQLPRYAGPLLVQLPGHLTTPESPWAQMLRLDPAVLHDEYGIRSCAVSCIDAHAFARMLAKVAHGLAVAELGRGGFVPYLPPVILGNDPQFLKFVGSVQEAEPATTESFAMNLATFGEAPNRVITAQLRLFADRGAPGYRIIVGHYPKDNDLPFDVPYPEEGEFAAARDLRYHLTIRPPV